MKEEVFFKSFVCIILLSGAWQSSKSQVLCREKILQYISKDSSTKKVLDGIDSLYKNKGWVPSSDLETMIKKANEALSFKLNSIGLRAKVKEIRRENLSHDVIEIKMPLRNSIAYKQNQFFFKTLENFIKKGGNKDSIEIDLFQYIHNHELGTYSSKHHALNIGIHQLQNIFNQRGQISQVAKHELRHLLFESNRNSGRENIFDIRFYRGKSVALNKYSQYDTFLSAEELFNYSKDLNPYYKKLREDKKMKIKSKTIQSLIFKLSQIKIIAGTLEKHLQVSIKKLQKINSIQIVNSNKMAKDLNFIKVIDDRIYFVTKLEDGTKFEFPLSSPANKKTASRYNYLLHRSKIKDLSIVEMKELQQIKSTLTHNIIIFQKQLSSKAKYFVTVLNSVSAKFVFNNFPKSGYISLRNKMKLINLIRDLKI